MAEDLECVCCMAPLLGEDDVTSLMCGHTFHTYCIKRQMEVHHIDDIENLRCFSCRQSAVHLRGQNSGEQVAGHSAGPAGAGRQGPEGPAVQSRFLGAAGSPAGTAGHSALQPEPLAIQPEGHSAGEQVAGTPAGPAAAASSDEQDVVSPAGLAGEAVDEQPRRRASRAPRRGVFRIPSSQQRGQFREIHGPWTPPQISSQQRGQFREPWTPPQIQNEPGEEGTSSQGTQDMLPVLDLGDDIDTSQAYALAVGEPVYRHARRRMEFQSGVAKRARVHEQSREPVVELLQRLTDLRESGAPSEAFSDTLHVDASFRGLETQPKWQAPWRQS